MEFRKAFEEEKNDVLKLYNDAKNEHLCVWNDDYPTIFEVEEDFKTNNLYVLVADDKVIGALSVVPENEMDDFEEWEQKDNVIETARIVIAKEYQGNGYSLYMIKSLIEKCKLENISAIHLSCQCENIPAIKTYKKAGFKFLCTKFMYGNNYYLCEYLF